MVGLSRMGSARGESLTRRPRGFNTPGTESSGVGLPASESQCLCRTMFAPSRSGRCGGALQRQERGSRRLSWVWDRPVLGCGQDGTFWSWSPRSPSPPWGRSRLCSHHVTGGGGTKLATSTPCRDHVPLALQRRPSCPSSVASRAAGRGDGEASGTLSSGCPQDTPVERTSPSWAWACVPCGVGEKKPAPRPGCLCPAAELRTENIEPPPSHPRWSRKQQLSRICGAFQVSAQRRLHVPGFRRGLRVSLPSSLGSPAVWPRVLPWNR